MFCTFSDVCFCKCAFFIIISQTRSWDESYDIKNYLYQPAGKTVTLPMFNLESYFNMRDGKGQCHTFRSASKKELGPQEKVRNKEERGANRKHKKEDCADRVGLTVQARVSSSTQINTCRIRVCYYGDGNQRYHCPGESDLQPTISDLVHLYIKLDKVKPLDGF